MIRATLCIASNKKKTNAEASCLPFRLIFHACAIVSCLSARTCSHVNDFRGKLNDAALLLEADD